MNNFQLITTKELQNLIEFYELDPMKFEEELALIKQELIIRKLPYCKPLCDVLEGVC